MPDIATIPLSVSSARPLAYQGFLCFLSAHAHLSSACACVCVSPREKVYDAEQLTPREILKSCEGKTVSLLGFIFCHKQYNLTAKFLYNLDPLHGLLRKGRGEVD